MSIRNKQVVRKLNKAFEADDVETILSCLADDISWDVPGHFTCKGKQGFKSQIHNDAFEGAPVITIKNEIAEGDYLAVEGTVTSKFKGGAPFNAVFHNTYLLKDNKVKAMTSYVVPMTQ
jgi:uncharacterized protein